MSVLIKGMEMPKDCRECPFEMYYFHCGETRCRATLRTLATEFKSIPFDGRADDCPLIELPPHGRLIDADALKFRLKAETGYAGSQQITTDFLCVLKDDIEDAPTIIEAEEEEYDFSLQGNTRSVVMCKDCRHRDPEDHKCDCGQLERAGCVFPVDDDYFCAYGENK